MHDTTLERNKAIVARLLEGADLLTVAGEFGLHKSTIRAIAINNDIAWQSPKTDPRDRKSQKPNSTFHYLLGKKLKIERERAGLTLQTMAAALEISWPRYAAMEDGKVYPSDYSLEEMKKLARYLKCKFIITEEGPNVEYIK